MSLVSVGGVEHLASLYKQRLLREANLDDLTALPRHQLRDVLQNLVKQWLVDDKAIISRQDQDRLLTLITDEAAGFGPLEPLLADPDITEIMVNRPDEIWIERGGRLQRAAVRFQDDQHIKHTLERIVAPIGRRVDESSPMVDARLPDGSRVNGVIPPISLQGPVLTIRKFRKTPWRLDDLIQFSSLSSAMATFLSAAVVAKQNIVVSGGTGSGKTSLLTAVAASIPPGERIITIEDMAELRFERPNVVSLEARPRNVEGRGEITIRSLVRNALRMRPDRIIVGEVRGDEALDMLQAMNTGHEGSLTTIHANNPLDAVGRLEAMVVMANTALPVEVIRQHLVSSLDLVVQTERLSDGSRKVVSITEVQGVHGGQVVMQELFRFEQQGLTDDGRVTGTFTGCDIEPQCLSKMRRVGLTLPPGIFSKG